MLDVRCFLSALLWPNPRAWAALAAMWLMILAVNFTTADKTETVAKKTAPPSPEMILVLREQQRELARLIGPFDEPAAEPPKTGNLRPRGAARSSVAFV
jgi:hypothetical protein